MIAKAGTGSDFGGVMRYVLSKDKAAEVIHSQQLFSRLEHEGAARVVGEMRACAELSGRCKKPVYHLTLSWAPGDAPTPEQVAVTAQRFLRDLGLQEHQALVVRHRDTAHEHVHIVVNRVHPDTRKAWAPPHWQRGLHALCRRIERDMGWRLVAAERAPNRARPRAGEQTAERKRGVEPLAKEINRKCGERLSTAATWRQLERILQAHGYTLEQGTRHRQGLSISNGRRQVSASRVRRDLSRPKLEKRFGFTLEGERKARERRLEARALEREQEWDWGL